MMCQSILEWWVPQRHTGSQRVYAWLGWGGGSVEEVDQSRWMFTETEEGQSGYRYTGGMSVRLWAGRLKLLGA